MNYDSSIIEMSLLNGKQSMYVIFSKWKLDDL